MASHFNVLKLEIGNLNPRLAVKHVCELLAELKVELAHTAP